MRTTILRIIRLLSCFLFCLGAVNAQQNIAQTLSIYTHFKTIVDKPTWLIILRDIQSGEVLPYLFDIRQNENFWLAFSKEHAYRVTASVLKFGAYASINNFCGIENGILHGKSMYITVTGVISPDSKTSKCHVIKFNQQQFPIAE